MIKKRVNKIINELKENEALLILSDSNRFYFTGFHSSAGSVLITKDEAYFFIDFRYFEKAKSVVNSCRVILCEKRNEQIYNTIKEHRIDTLFIETNYVCINELKDLRSNFCNIQILDDARFDKIIEEMRSIKNREELVYIKEAQKLTDKTFEYILNNIKEGRTEKEIMLDMEFYMRRLGSEGVSFDFIVVSGENSSLPHGVPTDKPIEKGDFITMDFGAVVNGYRSDMTRTVALGDISEEQKRVYETVLKAQLDALSYVKTGAKCNEIDKIARDVIYSNGYEGCFGHGLGHSVGIDIHEMPSFSPRCTTVLKTGMVMTVEPGIYIENKFGVRIEDMIFVTDNGFENITKSEKKLIIL